MPSQRISSLDLIRGIAVLGILFMNIYAFTMPTTALVTPDWHGSESISDRLIFSFQYIFMHGKFYTLFALLFGAGLVLLSEKWHTCNEDKDKLIKRRLKWLTLFGLIHTIFLWNGDILFSYAIAGLIAYRHHQLSSSDLLRKGIKYIVMGNTVFFLLWLNLTFFAEHLPAEFADKELFLSNSLNDEYAVWNSGYLSNLTNNLQMLLMWSLLGIIGFWWAVAGTMMIGMSLYKSQIFQYGFSNRHITLFVLTGFSLVLLELGYQWYTNFEGVFAQHLSIFFTLYAFPIAFIYIHFLVKKTAQNPHALLPLQNVGKMAFTLYIMQTLIMLTLFQWFGAEDFGNYDRLTVLYWAIAIAIFQIIFANVYLHYFKQGPLEALWRYLVLRPTKKSLKF